MALSVESLAEEHLLRDYLRTQSRDGSNAKVRSPGHDLRTCADCGERTAFTMDPEGTWFRCTSCGAYA